MLLCLRLLIALALLFPLPLLLLCCAVLFLLQKITTLSLQAVNCTELPGSREDAESSDASINPFSGKTTYLKIDMSTRCYQGDHMIVLTFVWLLILGFAVGYPVLCFYIMYRAFNKNAQMKELMEDKQAAAELDTVFAKVQPDAKAGKAAPDGGNREQLLALAAGLRERRERARLLMLARVETFGYLFRGLKTKYHVSETALHHWTH